MANSICLLGIDPDFRGGLVTVRWPQGEIIDVKRMPVFEKKPPLNEPTRIDVKTLQNFIVGARRLGAEHVVLERAVVRPQVGKGGKQVMQGSVGRTHEAFGAIRAVSELAFTRSRVILAHPSVWKKALSLSSDKTKSMDLACEIFPHHTRLFGMPKNVGLAEAALLTKWGSASFLTFTS